MSRIGPCTLNDSSSVLGVVGLQKYMSFGFEEAGLNRVLGATGKYGGLERFLRVHKEFFQDLCRFQNSTRKWDVMGLQYRRLQRLQVPESCGRVS